MNPLVQARHKRGLSQQDLATVTGFSRQLIQRYESGRSNRAPVELCAFFDDSEEVPLGTHAVAYMRYINSRRAELPLSAINRVLSTETVPAIALKRIRNYIENKTAVRPEIVGASNAPLSDSYFVAATMHVHPYSLQKWQETGKVPVVLYQITQQSEAKNDAA